jgi:hypothetical protein
MPSRWTTTTIPTNMQISSPIIQVSVVRALRHSTGLNAGTALEIASMPVIAVEPDAKAQHEQQADALGGMKDRSRHWMKAASGGVEERDDHQQRNREDERVCGRGEQRARLAHSAGSRWRRCTSPHRADRRGSSGGKTVPPPASGTRSHPTPAAINRGPGRRRARAPRASPPGRRPRTRAHPPKARAARSASSSAPARSPCS